MEYVTLNSWPVLLLPVKIGAVVSTGYGAGLTIAWQRRKLERTAIRLLIRKNSEVKEVEKQAVQQIAKLQSELGDLVVKVVPLNSDDWNALEKLTAAHKQLRSIDVAALGQEQLPLK